MVAIEIKKGLDIPMEGAPVGDVEPLKINGLNVKPRQVALDLSSFSSLGFRLLVKQGDVVKIGQPLLHDKKVDERFFVSPGSGVVSEINRGLKRRLLSIVIDLAPDEESVQFPPIDPLKSDREAIIARLLEGGAFPYIRQRPFDLLADPNHLPKAIYVKAIESAPFVPSAEMQVAGHESSFQIGLDALSKLTHGKVHLVHRAGSPCKAFTEAKNVEIHTINGPHPAGNSSVHIHNINPIERIDEVVWTIDTVGVITVGQLLNKGTAYIDRVISVGGSAVIPGRTGYFKARSGFPISDLIDGRIPRGEVLYVSGGPLMGTSVEPTGFMGFYDTALALIPKNQKQQFLHFFGLGLDKYTASRTYLSGFLKNRLYSFDDNQHGERRHFVISQPYDNVMPMRINTTHLVKAVMAKDFDLAEKLGMLEVAPEDFALATFVDPCKIEMVDIMREGLQSYSKEIMG